MAGACLKFKLMSDIAIKLENISKQYRLGVVGTGTLSHDLNRWWAKMRGKTDPSLKIGQENSLAKAGGEYVWALKDINLEVKKGEILGIIGKNGAGKSTLLKLLSQVTGPTTGSIKVNGRIASLLEVGTGFHPELTGRENIFLNGAILGMTKTEIKSKLDEIIEFAGVAKYVDTPVKRYSSGMYVRLAFAVAAHLEPDILVVDEVLAVGDAEFQKKAIGKMQDVSKGGGRTVLFVSHNMASIQQLCKRGVLLENGMIVFNGSVEDTINKYISNQNRIASYENEIHSKIYIKSFKILNSKNVIAFEHLFSENIKLNWLVKISEYFKGMVVGIQILTAENIVIFSGVHNIAKDKIVNNEMSIFAEIPSKLLLPNKYVINTSIHIPNKEVFDKIHNEIGFNIVDTGSISTQFKKKMGFVNVNLKWS